MSESLHEGLEEKQIETDTLTERLGENPQTIDILTIFTKVNMHRDSLAVLTEHGEPGVRRPFHG